MSSSIVLLPQSPKSLLLSATDKIRILKLKKILVKEAILALKSFLNDKNINRFDGHVGETLCQIRACQLRLLKESMKDEFILRNLPVKINMLKNILLKLNDIILYYETNRYKKQEHCQVEVFLYNNELTCDLSELEVYLVQLYFLSKFKKFDQFGDISIDYGQMRKKLGLSKNIARRIVHIYQVSASRQSTNFISSIIEKNLNKNYSSFELFKMVKKSDDDERSTLPCFWAMYVLYEEMVRQKCPILFVCKRMVKYKSIDEIFLIFKVSSGANDGYEFYDLNEADSQSLCLVVKGIANYDNLASVLNKKAYIDNFIEQGVRNILFANMAAHPQYTGKKLRNFQDSPYLMFLEQSLSEKERSGQLGYLLKNLHYNQEEMRNYALEIGCAKSVPSFFYIKHIFCDLLKNLMRLDKHKYKELPLKSYFVAERGYVNI